MQEERLVALLHEKGLTITTAESCTGGLLSGTIINVSGTSDVFKLSVVTYANEAKHKMLGVSNKTLKKHGAVSKQTAKQMAKGAAKLAEAEVALSVTGIAGPTGGTKEKPVGLVYIGCRVCGKTKVVKCQFKGDRTEVRMQTVARAIDLAIECIETMEND